MMMRHCTNHPLNIVHVFCLIIRLNSLTQTLAVFRTIEMFFSGLLVWRLSAAMESTDSNQYFIRIKAPKYIRMCQPTIGIVHAIWIGLSLARDDVLSPFVSHARLTEPTLAVSEEDIAWSKWFIGVLLVSSILFRFRSFLTFISSARRLQADPSVTNTQNSLVASSVPPLGAAGDVAGGNQIHTPMLTMRVYASCDIRYAEVVPIPSSLGHQTLASITRLVGIVIGLYPIGVVIARSISHSFETYSKTINIMWIVTSALAFISFGILATAYSSTASIPRRSAWRATIIWVLVSLVSMVMMAQTYSQEYNTESMVASAFTMAEILLVGFMIWFAYLERRVVVLHDGLARSACSYLASHYLCMTIANLTVEWYWLNDYPWLMYSMQAAYVYFSLVCTSYCLTTLRGSIAHFLALDDNDSSAKALTTIPFVKISRASPQPNIPVDGEWGRVESPPASPHPYVDSSEVADSGAAASSALSLSPATSTVPATASGLQHRRNIRTTVADNESGMSGADFSTVIIHTGRQTTFIFAYVAAMSICMTLCYV
jgi:hypothetical protein